MIKWVILLVGGVLLAGLSEAHEYPTSRTVQFAADLYTAVREANPDNNTIISPLSVQTALGLLLMGAGGNTAEQIVRGLRFESGNQSTIASYFEDSLERYLKTGVVNVANKVFSAAGLTVHPEFNDVARSQFNSEAETVNFREPRQAAQTINSWVQNRTNNKIMKMFDSDELNPGTRMVLANAVHFKAAWANQFNEHRTLKVSFYYNNSSAKRVHMMDKIMHLKYSKVSELDSKMALFEYADTDLGMLIILPNTRTGLDALEEKLKTYNFLERAKALSTINGRVRVRLPKFTVETSVDLTAVLTQMGMGGIFSSGADFSKLFVESEQVSVGSAVHKAYIKVDEKGTEAAAITGFPIIPISSGPKFICDHPFFFAIIGPQDVLFIGSVRLP